ncbi:MAG: hypothetical protein ACK2U3_05360 [Anaerolineales bacterium]|jgi:hypothetical protein
MVVDFLNEFEVRRLEELAEGEFPYNGWAKAILLLNRGASYGEAGRASGLTARQARYRRDKYLMQRLDMFPGGAAGDWVPASKTAFQETGESDIAAGEQVESGVVEPQPDFAESVEAAKIKNKSKKKKSEKSNKGKKKKKKKDKSKSGKKKKGKKKGK